MKKMNGKLLVAALLAAGSVTAHAAAVVGMTIADTIHTDLNGAAAGAPDGLGQDGKSGAFRFAPIDGDTYAGAWLFEGDVGGGVIDVTQANAAGSFTSGYLYATAPFVPFTSGPIVADITGGVLSITSLPWGGNYAGMVDFDLPPDPGTLVVDNLIQTGVNTYAYRIHWSHFMTQDEVGPAYAEYTAYWYLEGTMTVVPEPETSALMVAGLGLVAAAARRRVRKVGG